MGMFRVFLALSVLIHHVGPNRPFWWVHAGVAVILFYMISGFYMALVLNEKYTRSTEFYAARFIRLYPTYLVTLAIIVIWFIYNDTPTVLTSAIGLPPLEQAALAFMNLFVIGQDAFQVVDFQFYIEQSHLIGGQNPVAHAFGVLLSRTFFRDDWMLIGQAWTLSSEMLFYLLAPRVVRSLPRILSLMSASLLIRFGIIFGLGYASADWGYHFFPATLCFFLMGSLSYHLFRDFRLRAPRMTQSVGAGFVTLFAAYGLYGIVRGQGMLATFSYDSVKLWAVYLLCAFSIPFVFAATSASRWDRWIGELSYPIYLNHGLILGAMSSVIGIVPTSVTGTVTAMVISVAAAAAMHLAVERPAAYALRRGGAIRILRVGAGMVMTGCVAIAAGVGIASTMEPASATVLPYLVGAAHGYNIVQMGKDWYAIPIGVPANLTRDKPATIPGLLAAGTQEQILGLAATHPVQSREPVLVATVGNFNVVEFRDRWYAIPHGLPVDWAKDNVERLPGVLSGVTRDQATAAAIAAK